MSTGGFSNIRVQAPTSPPDLDPIEVDLGQPERNYHVDPSTGASKVELDNGSVVINFNPQATADDDGDFYANLATRIDAGELSRIAEDILQGIEADNQSRAQWLATRARGIDLLGLKLQQPRTEVGSAPLEGMSTVSHPLLLEATLRFQSTARGELLPSSGPVKVRDDDDQGGNITRDALAEAMEIDLNHYLTVTAPEYYPDTDRMLFYVGFGGCGFKKVYTCPIRRRPVSESVDAKDLIVSDAVSDLRNAGRVTHRILMRNSVLKRMQLVGAYRDIPFYTPPPPTLNEVDRKIGDIQGILQDSRRPEDREREIDESYVELDIKGFEHKDKKGKATGLPLPYRVSIDKDTRQVLEVRRNWDPEDDQQLALQVFVKYPFVAGLGFYDIGLVHILGNATIALTAAWREMLDAGMFASFPGGLIARQVARQETNEFRIAPGSFAPVETGGAPIQESVMPLPYKDVSQGLLGLTESIMQIAQRVGGTAETVVGEGSQEAPVGTTLALIEQATKTMDAVHKRIHAAQAEEFGLLKREFKKDPASIWRGNKRSKVAIQLGVPPGGDIDPAALQRFTLALDDCDMVPAADPNTPSEMHRLMKAQALIQMMQMSQMMPEGRLDPRRVLEYALRTIRINTDMFAPPPDPNQPPPMDPKVQAAMIQAQAGQQKVQIAAMQSQDKQREIEAKQRMGQVELQRDVIAHHTAVAQSRPEPENPYAAGGIVSNANIHNHEQLMAQHERNMAMMDHAEAQRQRVGEYNQSQLDMQKAAQDQRGQQQADSAKILQALIAHQTKKLDIEKAKVDAKKPKPKPAGK